MLAGVPTEVDRVAAEAERRVTPIPDDYRNAWSVKRQMHYLSMGYSPRRIDQMMSTVNTVSWRGKP